MKAKATSEKLDNSINRMLRHTKPHFCASGSLLLPLAQKWGLVGVTACATLVALALPYITAPTAFAATAITLRIPGSFSLTTSSSDTAGSEATADVSLEDEGYWGYILSIASDSEKVPLPLISKECRTIPSIVEEKDNVNDFGNAWGWKITGGSTANSKFRPGPTKDATLLDDVDGEYGKTTKYTLTLGAKVDGTQPAGAYTGQIVIMATAKTVQYSLSYLPGGDDDKDVAMPKDDHSGETTDDKAKVTLSETVLTLDGYNFLGWCDQQPPSPTSECPGQFYEPGGTIEWELQKEANANNKQVFAIWKLDPPRDLGYLGTMQEFKCSEKIPRVTDYGTVTDTRDNNIYRVRKLKDGQCWMIDNIKIMDKTISSIDSDIVGDPFTIPASNKTSFGSSLDVDSAYLAVDSGSEKATFGGYYSWHAATAGTGKKHWPLEKTLQVQFARKAGDCQGEVIKVILTIFIVNIYPTN